MELRAWDETIGKIYAAAASPNLWPDTLQTIARLFEGRGALLLYRRETGQLGTIVSPSFIDMAREYDEHWQHSDVRAERVLRAVADGDRDVQVDHRFFTDEEAQQIPIYRDFLAPHGVGWGMTVPVSPSPAVVVILTLLRAHGLPGYSEAEQERMLALSRHVERALSLSIRLVEAEVERLGFSQALDRMDCGAVVVGEEGRVLFANATAGTLLGGSVQIAEGRLRLRDPAAQERLAERLSAPAGNDQVGGATAKALIVADGDRSLILEVIRVQQALTASSLQEGRAIVLITDQALGRPFDPSVVRDLFKLTMGEARLAALIGAGTPPNEAAAMLGIAESTGRTVLKRVFEKMGVSRQSEMAALMSRLFMLRT